jgi:hypothetical protein
MIYLQLLADYLLLLLFYLCNQGMEVMLQDEESLQRISPSAALWAMRDGKKDD